MVEKGRKATHHLLNRCTLIFGKEATSVLLETRLSENHTLETVELSEVLWDLCLLEGLNVFEAEVGFSKVLGHFQAFVNLLPFA